MGLKSIFNLRDNNEAPIYNIFIGPKGVTLGVQIDKYVPRNQTYQDYGGENRFTYKMLNPFKPSQEHFIVGVNDALQMIYPLLINGEPRNVGGYSARVIFQDYFGNVLHKIVPPQMEADLSFYKTSYFLVRKELSKFLGKLNAMSQRDEMSQKLFLNVIKEYRSVFFSGRDEDRFGGASY